MWKTTVFPPLAFTSGAGLSRCRAWQSRGGPACGAKTLTASGTCYNRGQKAKGGKRGASHAERDGAGAAACGGDEHGRAGRRSRPHRQCRGDGRVKLPGPESGCGGIRLRRTAHRNQGGTKSLAVIASTCRAKKPPQGAAPPPRAAGFAFFWRTTNPPLVWGGHSHCVSDKPCRDLWRKPLAGDAVVAFVLLDEQIPPIALPCGHAGGAAAGKGIQHKFIGFGVGANERH